MGGKVRVMGGMLAVSLVLGCAGQQAAGNGGAQADGAGQPDGVALLGAGTLRAVDGRAVGTARIVQGPSGPVLQVEVTGLPAGVHATHIHGVGQCAAAGAPAFASAGGHFNPGSRQHGRRNPAGPHAGDLPNITVDASGQGRLEVPLNASYVASGAGTLFDDDGSAVVVHANADDEVSDQSAAGPGNSGGRIACAVITRS